MIKIISTWRPWNYYKASFDARIDMLVNSNSSLCIKGVNDAYLYGINSWTMFKMPFFKGKSNDDLVEKARKKNINISIWTYHYFKDPSGEAKAIHKAIERWNPDMIFLDIEGDAKKYPKNTTTFLASLGRVKPKVYLQSYYRPSLHPEILWETLLSYKAGGEYVIDGISPQAYPYDNDFVSKYEKMVQDYSTLLKKVKRENIPWLPTLPTFTEHNWTPSRKGMEEGINFLKNNVNLEGINFWRQSFLFEMPDILDLITSIDTTQPPPIQDEENQDKEKITVTLPKLIILSDYLNIRKYPSTSSPIVGYLTKNQVTIELECKYISPIEQWSRIGHDQWIAKLFNNNKLADYMYNI